MTKLAVVGAILAASAMQAPAKTELQRPADWITRADPGTDVSYAAVLREHAARLAHHDGAGDDPLQPCAELPARRA